MSFPVPVYALVCDELPERRDALVSHLKERSVEPHLWRGFYGRQWGLETSREFDPGKRLPPGHVGLNLGAWAMWQHAMLSAPPEGRNLTRLPTDDIIFLEDDAVLCEDFQERFFALYDKLDRHFPDWDLVFIGTCGQEPQVWHKVTERIGGADSQLCRMCDPFGTHAMMVRRGAIPTLLEHMRGAERNLDQQLWQWVLQPGLLKWCAALPTLVTQRTYDHKGTGTPEWAPSTLRPGEEPKPPEEAAGRPSAQTMAATSAFINPYPCLFRGEQLSDHGRCEAPKKSVPVTECARLNEPCHQKTGYGPVATKYGPAVACQTCDLRLEMGQPLETRPRLALPEGHFNPGMIRYGGRLILATRDSWGHSRVALWELNNDRPDWTGDWKTTPIGSHASAHQLAPRLEDPRLFTMPHPVTRRESLCAMFSLPDGYPPKLVKVGYVRFAEDLSGIEETVILDSPFGNLYEKNWMPLFDREDNDLRWVYSYKPNHVVRGGMQIWKTYNPFAWTGGVIRGGATPVSWTFPDGEVMYYHFFHGVLKRLEGSVYTVGCNVFEAKPPYRVLRQTPVPLLWPDLPAPGEDVVKRCVLWPGGAVPHAGAWHIALGVDDTFVRITRVPFADVESALVDVPGGRETLSIRDTPIALGVRKGGV